MKFGYLGWFIQTFIIQFIILYIAKEELFLWVSGLIVVIYVLMYTGVYLLPGVLKVVFSKTQWKHVGLLSFGLSFLLVGYLNGLI